MADNLIIQKSIQSQFMASLDMLKETIEKCPEAKWFDDGRIPGFWQVAYHALFYVHLYIQPTIADFKHRQEHREHAEDLGAQPSAVDEKKAVIEAYNKAEILAYLVFCREQVKAIVPKLVLEGESGFDWLPMSKLELQFYSIRHLMQHTGELSERLNAQTGLEIAWRAMEK